MSFIISRIKHNVRIEAFCLNITINTHCVLIAKQPIWTTILSLLAWLKDSVNLTIYETRHLHKKIIQSRTKRKLWCRITCSNGCFVIIAKTLYVFCKYVVQLFHLSRQFLICIPTAIAMATGTALPIWRATSTLFPTKMKSSGKVCNIAPSRKEMLRFCSG